MAGFDDWTDNELKGFSTGAKYNLIIIQTACPHMVSLPKKKYYPNAALIEDIVIKDLGRSGDGYKYNIDSREYRWDTWIGGDPLDDELFYFFFKDEAYAKKLKRRLRWLIILRIKRWLGIWCIKFWKGILKRLPWIQQQSTS